MQQLRLCQALGEQRLVGGEDEAQERVVKSAGRVFQILELFDVLKRESLVCEVSDLLGFPQSSTSVLLRSMVWLGYLSYNRETRAYAPTTKVALLGSWVNGPLVGDGTLLRLLDRINARTGQAVVLGVRNQVWAQYIHVVQATTPVRLFVVKGSKRPLAISAAGLALLADFPDAEIKRIAMRLNSEAPEGDHHVGIAALMQQIEAIRAKGYAFTYDVVTPGGGMIAMLLPAAAGQEQLVLGVGGTTDVLRKCETEFLSVMREEIAAHSAQTMGNGATSIAPPASAPDPDPVRSAPATAELIDCGTPADASPRTHYASPSHLRCVGIS